MKQPKHSQLYKQLSAGKVYRRKSLARLSKAIDRDLKTLVDMGLLEKVAPGTYYKPQSSRYGLLPPTTNNLVKTFLRDDDFLIFTWNEYNKLGLGLTQIYNSTVVYNYKRHCKCELGGLSFDFRRPARGFPKALSREYLLVDLVNNLSLLAEDTSRVKSAIKKNLYRFDMKLVLKMACKYGKVSTRHFFEGLDNEPDVPARAA